MSCKVARELDLTQSTLGKNGLLKDLGDLFDSDIFACLRVFGSTEEKNTPCKARMVIR
jgi:hypothetical protein